jgi:S-adenosylmethionine synthetase
MATEIIHVTASPIQSITAESVGEGHPDKSADTISGLVVGEHLMHDPLAHVAAETTLTSLGPIYLGGEITSGHNVSIAKYESLVRGYLKGLGWNQSTGYDPDELPIHVVYTSQSQDIAQGIEGYDSKKIGAGDQGITVGFAIRNQNVLTDERLPLPIALSRALLYEIDKFRRENNTPLKPDMKSQLDVVYGSNGLPSEVENVVFALSHMDEFNNKKLNPDEIRELIREVVRPVFDRFQVSYDLSKALINGTHRFVVAGARGDTGLTGRKIVVDQFGPDVPVGGGAFHGKDPSKADVTGAYLARWVANQVVGNELADQCLVRLNWAIGQPEPFNMQISTGGTERIPIESLKRLLARIDLSLGVAIDRFGMRRPQESGILYDRLGAWGPYGNTGDGSARPWETIVEPDKWKQWEFHPVQK